MRAAKRRPVCEYVQVIMALCVLTGCGDRGVPLDKPAQKSTSTLDQVCAITADLVAFDPSRLNAETSLADLGADDLDLAELVVQLEDHFDIEISDDAVTNTLVVNGSRPDLKNVTMAKLASVIDDQKRSGGRRSPRSTEGLHQPEVRTEPAVHGTNDNPEVPQVKVYLNPLALLLAGAERQKGRPLTREEVLEVRNNAKFIMMSPEQAEKYYTAIDAKIDIYRIDPDHVWEEWQHIQDQVK